MFDFQLITDSNGWAMALAGALIVMGGLAILTFIISQLHRLVAVIEKKETAKKADGSFEIPQRFPADIVEVAKFYDPLVKQLASTFRLDELYTLTAENHYPHPHLTIRSFREAGILIPQGDGIYTWKSRT